MSTGPSRPAGTANRWPANSALPFRATAPNAIHAADEARDEGGAGLLVELDRRAHLLKPAVVHHHDLVAHGERLGPDHA